MSIRLGELFNELEYLKPKDKINKQTDFVKISRLAEQYPVKHHKLEKADNYKKKLYLSILSAIAQINNDNREGKLVFLHRILLGIKYEGSFESIVKDGMETSDKTIGEFVKCMEDKESKQLFIFESLVISNLGGEIDDITKKYISEVSSYLGITKDEMIFLIKLSVCVLEQSCSKYKQLVNNIPNNVSISTFSNSYLRDFVKGVICDTKSTYYVYGIDVDGKMINLISSKNFEGMQVIFENVRFDLKINNKDLSLNQSDSVFFYNCDFKSEDKNINFEAVNDILFYKCKFKGFKKRVCLFNSECKEVKIERCTFEECGYIEEKNLGGGRWYSPGKNERYYHGGGCFYIYKINSFILKDSEFTNCYVKNGDDAHGAIAYIEEVNNFQVNKVFFTNCCDHSKFDWLQCLFYIRSFIRSNDYDDEKYKKHFINCKTTNSTKLY